MKKELKSHKIARLKRIKKYLDRENNHSIWRIYPDNGGWRVMLGLDTYKLDIETKRPLCSPVEDKYNKKQIVYDII
jgi:hypothetical protein